MTLPQDASHDHLILLTADIDDESPEILSSITGKLLNEGARDVTRTPVAMKKGRLGTRLEVLCDEDIWQFLAAMILLETSTIGVRKSHVERYGLARELIQVEMEGITVRVKVVLWNSRFLRAKPEHDDCVAAARALDKTIAKVAREATILAEQAYEK